MKSAISNFVCTNIKSNNSQPIEVTSFIKLTHENDEEIRIDKRNKIE